MTLEELIISFDRPGYTPKKLADAILGWHKKELIKELEAVAEDYRILRKRIAELKED